MGGVFSSLLNTDKPVCFAIVTLCTSVARSEKTRWCYMNSSVYHNAFKFSQSRDPTLHMRTCDRLGWNTSRPWFQASLMEGICPEAFHLAHNREPGTHLDCICTVGAWPQRKEIIDPELQCCRGSGQLLVFLFTSGGNALIYMRANIKLWIVLAKPAPENRFMPVRVLDSC